MTSVVLNTWCLGTSCSWRMAWNSCYVVGPKSSTSDSTIDSYLLGGAGSFSSLFFELTLGAGSIASSGVASSSSFFACTYDNKFYPINAPMFGFASAAGSSSFTLSSFSSGGGNRLTLIWLVRPAGNPNSLYCSSSTFLRAETSSIHSSSSLTMNFSTFSGSLLI